MDRKLETELAGLDREVWISKVIVIAAAALVPLIYGFWFWYKNGFELSQSSDIWGTFGDYVGGILNPIVAFFAFYWLIKSIRLQKEELTQTRHSLSEAADAQKKQVRLAALSALTNSIMAEVETQRDQLQFLAAQFHTHKSSAVKIWDLSGKCLDEQRARDLIKDINDRIEKRLTERFTYENEIKSILAEKQDTL